MQDFRRYTATTPLTISGGLAVAEEEDTPLQTGGAGREVEQRARTAAGTVLPFPLCLQVGKWGAGRRWGIQHPAGVLVLLLKDIALDERDPRLQAYSRASSMTWGDWPLPTAMGRTPGGNG